MTDVFQVWRPSRPFVLPNEREYRAGIRDVKCASCGFPGWTTTTFGGSEALPEPPANWLTHATTGLLLCSMCAVQGDQSFRFALGSEIFVSHSNGTQSWHTWPRREGPVQPAVDDGQADDGQQADKETDMSGDATGGKKLETPGVTTRLREHGGLLAGAALDGLKLAAVNETGEVFCDIARRAFKDNPMLVAALSDPDGRQLVMALTGRQHPGGDTVTTGDPECDLCGGSGTCEVPAGPDTESGLGSVPCVCAGRFARSRPLEALASRPLLRGPLGLPVSETEAAPREPVPISSALRFCGDGSTKPSTQARRHVEACMVAVMENALSTHDEWFFGGIEAEPDRRRVEKEMRRMIAKLLRRGRAR